MSPGLRSEGSPGRCRRLPLRAAPGEAEAWRAAPRCRFLRVPRPRGRCPPGGCRRPCGPPWQLSPSATHPVPGHEQGPGSPREAGGAREGPGSPRSPARIWFVGVQMQQEPRPGVSCPGGGASAPLCRGSPSCRCPSPSPGTNPPAAEPENPPWEISAQLLPSRGRGPGNPRAAPLIPGALTKRARAAASPISVASLQVSALSRSRRSPLRVCLT